MMQYKQLQHSNGILFVGIVLFNQFAVIIPAYGKTNIRQESALLNQSFLFGRKKTSIDVLSYIWLLLEIVNFLFMGTNNC